MNDGLSMLLGVCIIVTINLVVFCSLVNYILG